RVLAELGDHSESLRRESCLEEGSRGGDARRQRTDGLRPPGGAPIGGETGRSRTRKPALERIKIADGHLVLGVAHARAQRDRRGYDEGGVQEDRPAVLELIEVVVL